MRFRVGAGLVASVISLAAVEAGAASLTILHNNDGESALLPFDDPADHGGIARAVTAVNALRADAEEGGRDVLTLSSGDNFLPGLAREASRRDGVDYDARALDLIGYDAIALGNHDFDFGPAALAEFLAYEEDGRAYFADTPFVASNLDFTAETSRGGAGNSLSDLEEAGRIAASTVVERNGTRYGIIGGVTERLAQITNTGDVAIADFADAVRAEVVALEAAGVDHIIVISHLQGLANDIEVLSEEGLGNVDVLIAGGGDELLADRSLIGPATGEDVYGNAPADVPAGAVPAGSDANDTYPLQVQQAGGQTTYVVTTTGNYQYWGRLDVEFDEAGRVLSVTGDPVVIGPAFAEDPTANQRIAEPVAATVDAIASEVVGTLEVELDNARQPGKRTQEVNLGNLVADAFVWQAEQMLGDQLAGKVVIGLQNGGGIRGNDQDIGPGPLTRADTLALLPFSNFLSWTDDIDAAGLVAALEHAVSAVEAADGRFLHVSGVEFGYDPSRPTGDRLAFVRLPGGTTIYERSAGGLQAEASELDYALVTNSFIADGGDGFEIFAAVRFVDLAATYEQPLVNFIEQALGGVVAAASYPQGGEGRITETGSSGTL